MHQITPQIAIPDSELDISFARSGGPGGQNVNKVSSKVILRWNPQASQVLPETIKARLIEQQRSRLTKEGDLLITSQATRDQGRNLEDCFAKLRAIVERATRTPVIRKATKPTRASRKRRVEAKKRRSETKQRRRKGGLYEV